MKETEGWVKIKKYTDDEGKPRCGDCWANIGQDFCVHCDLASLGPSANCPIWHGESKSEWQPIETAPADGNTKVLLGWLDTLPTEMWKYRAIVAGDSVTTRGICIRGIATHWMPYRPHHRRNKP